MRIRCTSSGPSARRSVRALEVHLGQREVVGHPGAAPHLDGPVDDPVVGGRHEDLDGADLGPGLGVAVVDLLGGVDGHQPGGLQVHVAVGDEALHELLVLEEPAVDLAGEGPLDHQVEGPPHLADRVHAVEDAAGPEAVLCRLVPLADLAERVLDRAPARRRSGPRSGRRSSAPRCRCPRTMLTPWCRSAR